jgi:hypothetical protein
VPTIFIIYGFRFFFYSREETRIHIHIESQNCHVKIWLDNFEVADNHGFSKNELSKLLYLVRLHEKAIQKAWKEHFN